MIINNSDDRFSNLSNKYEISLDNEFKKNNGIFYTDLELAENMVNFLKIPQEYSIIDPCCGTGSFIHTLEKKGYGNIVGCDFDANTVKKCQELTNINNIFKIDTIGQSGTQVLNEIKKDSFDYVIGNPPYAPINAKVNINSSNEFKDKVANSGNNLFIAALYRAFEISKKEGYISVIVPKNLLHISAYKKIRELILKEKSIISIVELGIHFKTVRGEQIILTLQNCYKQDNKIKFYSYNKGKIVFLSEVPQEYYKNEIIVFTNNKEVLLYNKLLNNYKTLENVCVDNIHRGRDKGKGAIRGKQIRKYGFKDQKVPTEGNQIFIQNIFSAESGIIASYAGNLRASETVTIVKLKDAYYSKYILGILNSRLCNYYLIKFIFNNSRLTIHTDAKYLNKIPIVKNTKYINDVVDLVNEIENVEYMKKEWFELNEKINKLIYKIYRVKTSDVKYIEKEMKQISSIKWYKELK